MKKFLALMNDESGATAIEYGLIAALIAVAIIVATRQVGIQVKGTFTDVKNALASRAGAN